MSETQSERDLTVDTAFGPVRGEPAGDVDVWKGVRFAAPPTGEWRWRHAREPEAHTEVHDATSFGAVCPQPTMPIIDLGAGVRLDEDCLFLNVFSPGGAAARGDKRPVMVWVHGGAYVGGAGSQPLYDGSSLVRRSVASDVPVVIVTVNYRQGAFGFADLTSLSSGSTTYDANCGLSDVLAALRWVQGNIECFGGDPGNVTLFGESAGGGVVTTLLASPAAKGLIHKAIAQSSPATSVYDHARAETNATLLLSCLGFGKTNDGGSLLRHVDQRRLVSATTAVFNDVPVRYPGVLGFAPVIDGDLIPEHPVDAFRSGDVLDVPLMIGTNRDETSMFKWMKAPLMPVTQNQVDAMFEMIAQEQPELVIPEPDVIDTAYDGLKGTAKSMGIARDLGFRMPAVWIAEAQSRRAPVHLYRFDWATPLFRAIGIGATHATELPYIWGNPPSTRRDISYAFGGKRAGAKVGARMQERWVRFAATGDPSTEHSDATWEPYTSRDQHSLLIGGRDTAVTGLDREILQAWGSQVLSFR
ncbi:MAG: carboxylesterase/lipase family protein [Gordonia sp. (in: high G+C Gram-positive bacteria)]